MITYGQVADLMLEVGLYFHLSGDDTFNIIEDILSLEQPYTLDELKKGAFQYAQRLENS